MKHKLFGFLLTAIIFGSTASFAKTNPALEDTGWDLTIAPYAWALSMNGRVGVANQTAHLSQSFSEILQQLNVGAMAAAELRHNGVGVFFNGLYANISDGVSEGPYSVHVRNKFALISGGLSYEMYQRHFNTLQGSDGQFVIEPYIGFRYTENDTALKFSLPATSFTLNDNQYWTDPIVGARFITTFHNGLEINLAGDIGGINRSTQYSYNIVALLGYQPQTMWKNTKFYAGYRLLDQVYQNGRGINRFDWDMKLAGPVLGIAFTFN